MTKNVFDITILGGGPTGLFAAFYAGLRNASCKIIDSMPTLGGRLVSVYPEKYIYDVAGFPKILAQDLVTNLVEQINAYKPEICLNETALTLLKQDNGIWQIDTDQQQHFTKTLIIAAGVGVYTPKKHLAQNAEKFENNGIYYAVLNKNIFKDKKIAIVGGGDSALDWSHELAPIAKHVTLIHRSTKFRAHDSSISRLSANDKIDVLLNTEILSFAGEVHLERIHIKNQLTQLESIIDVDSVLVMFGYNSALGKIKDWGLELDKNGILVNERMETNLPGIFAAGDIAKHSAKLNLIVSGFAEAATAVAFAKVFINPQEKAQPLHSTTIMELKAKREKVE